MDTKLGITTSMETMRIEEALNLHSELKLILKVSLSTQYLILVLIQTLLILKEVSNRLRQFVAVSLRIQLVDTKHGITISTETMRIEEVSSLLSELKLST